MLPDEGRVRFLGYTLDLETRELTGAAGSTVLQDKPFCLLRALLERPGRVVSRPALHAALWAPGVHVERETGLNTAMRKLRAALRDASGAPCDLLQTVPRAGYRIAVDAAGVEPAGVPSAPAGRPRRLAVRTLLGLSPLVLALLAVVVWRGPGDEPVVPVQEMPRDAELRARYIEARSLLSTMGADLPRAQELLRSVLREQPAFSPARAYLAEAGARIALRSTRPELAEARAAAHEALRQDPDSAVAHRVLGMIALHFDWDVRTAERHLAHALELGPGDPATHLASAAYYSALGRHAEAVEAARRSIDLRPGSMLGRSDVGYFLLRAGLVSDAARECELVLRVDPDNAYAHHCLLAAHSLADDPEAARPHAIHLLQGFGALPGVVQDAATSDDPRLVYLRWKLGRLLDRPDPPSAEIAGTYLALGDDDGAWTWMETAARERSPMLIFLPGNTRFAPILATPRYRKLLGTAGLDAFLTEAAVASS